MERPFCDVCGAHSEGTTWPLTPKTPGHKFGEICSPCDEKRSEG